MKNKQIFFRKLFISFILFSGNVFSQNNCDYNNRSVYFGERSQQVTSSNINVIQIFMDKEGMYYPDFVIYDKEIENNCSSLKKWYKANKNKLDVICKLYNIEDTQNIDKKIELLNQAIINENLKKINNVSTEYDYIDILIHGFRKKTYGDIDSYSSYSNNDNKILRNQLSKNIAKKILFIEIYWDGKFITPWKSYKYKGFKLFENAAIPNANNVGLSLRQIISNIQNDNINIITHSLGARVAGETLFNSVGLPNENIYPTPSQKRIKICFIAPAIGFDFFNNFYARNSKLDYKNSDNYKIGIVYNTNDFVLLKHYGHGVNASPTEYGNTSLGCNYDSDIDKFTNLFNTSFKLSPSPVLFNFSISDNKPLGCHLISCYSEHENFQTINNFLYQ